MPADRSRAIAEISANAAHPAKAGQAVLTAVAIVLINRQLQSQARIFQQEGGFSERLHKVRAEHVREKEASNHQLRKSRFVGRYTIPGAVAS